MDKSPEIHLNWEALGQFTLTQPPPPPPPPQPHKQRWTSASEFQHCVGGGRELQEEFEKDALFY